MASLPIILSIETAGMGGSIFISRGSEELSARTGDPQISHSNTLLYDIKASLDEAGITLPDVELFACAAGPGSFTGLRIGLATVKSLAATLGRPCVGIPTLEAVALAAGPSDATVAIIPAGRGEVFAQMFSVSKDMLVSTVDQAAHLSPQKLVAKYAPFGRLLWTGEGVSVQAEFLRNYAQQHGIVITEQASELRDGERRWALVAKFSNLATSVGMLALQRFLHGQLQSPVDLSAIYVRPSDAELNKQAQ